MATNSRATIPVHTSTRTNKRPASTSPFRKKKNNTKSKTQPPRQTTELHIPSSQTVTFYRTDDWDPTKLTSTTLSIRFGCDFSIKDDHIKTVASQCPSLMKFEAGSQETGHGTWCTDTAIKELVDKCPHLHEVHLWSFTDVTDDGLMYLLEHLKNLIKVTITGHDKTNGKVTGKPLIALAGSKVLESWNQHKEEENARKEQENAVKRARKLEKYRERREEELAQEREEKGSDGDVEQAMDNDDDEDEPTDWELDQISTSEEEDEDEYGSGYGYSDEEDDSDFDYNFGYDHDMDDSDDDFDLGLGYAECKMSSKMARMLMDSKSKKWMKQLSEELNNQSNDDKNDNDDNDEKNIIMAPNLRYINLQDQSIENDEIAILKEFRSGVHVGTGNSVGSGYAAQYVHSLMGGGPEMFWY